MTRAARVGEVGTGPVTAEELAALVDRLAHPDPTLSDAQRVQQLGLL